MSSVAFELPARLEAHEPPEARGLTRDGVRLLVSDRADDSITHGRFADLPRFLAAGDLLVLNTSATLAAALPARRADGTALELRLSTPAEGRDPDRFWIVELRTGDAPFGAVEVGERLELPAGGSARILAPYAGVRLWLARLELPGPLESFLAEHGRAIRYGYVPRRWPLSAYQNVYAVEPGSAEMPSAGRPFTAELLTRLVAGGVLVAPVTLHTGVSSQERHERPYPERFRVPEQTARLVNAVRSWGGRVISTGTTVVRALETVAGPDGTVTAGEGWTNLVVTLERGLWTVDGLLTGLHESESSHLDLLRAVAGEELLARSYRQALEHGYRWHEFGDSQLILGRRNRR
ncbi:MAG: S-adenosylmethionine:tRNA ribosyltransferase-isomerase [Gaiellaceae bacterium MAG52_C11]|nr:S-adenosylmethionine:tRNA ribosyltransferase-isomerase [Candidatus Gaiellasilicea maunaloa]